MPSDPVVQSSLTPNLQQCLLGKAAVNRAEMWSQALRCLLLNSPPLLSSSVEILLILGVRVMWLKALTKPVVMYLLPSDCTSASSGSTTLFFTAVFVLCLYIYLFIYLSIYLKPTLYATIVTNTLSRAQIVQETEYTFCMKHNLQYALQSNQQLTAAPVTKKNKDYSQSATLSLP